MELTREEVLERVIPWETYTATKLISGTGLQLLRRYDRRQQETKAALLDENGAAYVRLFVSILRDITKEETIEYVLALLEEMLAANPKRARLFHEDLLANDDIYYPFLRLLNKKNWFIQETSCKILTLVISARPKSEDQFKDSNGNSSSKREQGAVDDVLKNLVDWVCNQLRHPSHPSRSAGTAVSSLATLLKDPYVRKLFVRGDGLQSLAHFISPASNQQYIQLLYEATLCVWLLSFNEACVDAISAAGILPRLVDVVKSSTKEKVVRVTILTLRNLLSKGNLASTMVDLGLLKIVQSLKLQTWADEDLTEALNALEDSLKVNIKTLSSFDKYKQEVMSGTLDWTPVHKDAVFWKENLNKFEDHDFQVLRVLITLLNTSKDPKTLAICCHDVSQFIQHHQSGRMIILDLKAKDRVMSLMEHDSPEVRREALLCIQKLLLRAKYASFLQS